MAVGKRLPSASPLIEANEIPAAFVNRYGQDRSIFIGKELLRTSIETKRAGGAAPAEALAMSLRDLVTASVEVDAQ